MAIKHTIRAKDNKTQEVTITPLKAIHYNCIECCGFEPVVDGINWIRDCLSPLCPLYPFRLGEAHSGKKVSEAQLKNLQKARMCQKNKANFERSA